MVGEGRGAFWREGFSFRLTRKNQIFPIAISNFILYFLIIFIYFNIIITNCLSTPISSSTRCTSSRSTGYAGPRSSPSYPTPPTRADEYYAYPHMYYSSIPIRYSLKRGGSLILIYNTNSWLSYSSLYVLSFRGEKISILHGLHM